MKTPKPLDGRKLILKEGWKIQNSEFGPGGDRVSAADFDLAGWHSTSLPATVLGSMVQNKVLDDPFYGMNLRKYPGMAYGVGENYSLKPIPEESPFATAWWFRNSIRIPNPTPGEHYRLHFDGINYRANIWVNGQKVGDQGRVAGTYRHFDFDITSLVKPDGLVTVAAEVFAPATPQCLSWSWIDWNPAPPDKDMGLWRDVFISRSGPVSLSQPKVISKLDLPSLKTAHLTVLATLRNETGEPVKGTLKGKIGDIAFSTPVLLTEYETKTVTFDPARHKNLNIKNPRLWWPYQMGAQEMHELELEFEAGGKVSDTVSTPFGIRQVTSELLRGEYRLFRINGQKILIRGAGWAPDMFLRVSPEREEQEVRYVRDMGLNTIRFEGSVASQHLLDLCDRYGILVMAGWQCCCHWERWNEWAQEDYPISEASVRDEIRRLFNHPCVFVWVNGSDFAPPPEVLQLYLDTLEREKWHSPSIASARVDVTIGGKTGVKMTGPYQYVPPSYWYIDTQKGGAHGFNTETSCGPAIPTVESLKKMIPAEHLWPQGEFWTYHCGGGPFANLNIFNQGLEKRYGAANSLEEYVLKAQVMVYDGHRAMYEAYSRNKYAKSTGVIQWMLNNAWPSMYWHLYDYYLQPGSSYFAAKKSNENLHVQYSYDDRSVVVVNQLYQSFKKARIKVRVFDFDLNEKFSKDRILDIPADASVKFLALPEFKGISTTYFVRLDATDNKGRTLSTNFYWLSTQKEQFDWEKTEFHSTPATVEADLTQLNRLPKARVAVSAVHKKKGEEGVTTVTVENKGKTLAFFLRLKLSRHKDKEEVLPVLWKDNYFSLLPGEERVLQAVYALKDLQGQKPVVDVEGWNLQN